MRENREYNPPGGPEIGSMIMIDRGKLIEFEMFPYRDQL